MLLRVLAGEDVGTLFWPARERRSSRAHWIAHTLRSKGTLRVDAGALRALTEKDRSLLPRGITAVEGDFEQGDPVDLAGPEGAVFARGLAAYGSRDLEKLRGRTSAEILELLGYHLGDEAVHKDDLALLGRA